MKKTNYSSDEINLLFNELAALIEEYEVDSVNGEQGVWESGGFFHIIPMGESGRLFALSLGEFVDDMLPQIMEAAWQLGADKITIFYLGDWNFSGDKNYLQKRIKEIQGFYNPGLYVQLCDINQIWLRYPVLLRDDGLLACTARENTANELSVELSGLKTGEADPHERLIRKIFNFVLPGCLEFFRAQVSSLDKSVRRDLIYSIKAPSSLKHYISNASLTSNNILVEAKNCKKNEGSHIDQLAGYIGQAKIASVGILITRSPLSDTLRKIIVDDRRERNGSTLIIFLCDDDLHQMLSNAKLAWYELNEMKLIEIAQEVLADTH